MSRVQAFEYPKPSVMIISSAGVWTSDSFTYGQHTSIEHHEVGSSPPPSLLSPFSHHHFPTANRPSLTPTSSLLPQNKHVSHLTYRSSPNILYKPPPPPPFSNHSILAARSQILGSSSISSHSCFRCLRSFHVAFGKERKGREESGPCTFHPP